MIKVAQRRFAPTVIGITRNGDRHQIGIVIAFVGIRRILSKRRWRLSGTTRTFSISGLRQNMRIYGGTIVAGCHDDEKLDIISAFQSYGEYLAGNIDDGRR
jgi:hypothetical protein